MLTHLVAISQNRVIGKNNDIPWRQKHDLTRFKQITTGNTVIMGRKTYDSILNRLGKPLPKRQSIVLTRARAVSDHDNVTFGDERSLEPYHDPTRNMHAFVVGGSDIYTLTLPYTKRILLTRIEANIDGDTWYPLLDGRWILKSKETYPSDADNQYPYSFCEYVHT